MHHPRNPKRKPQGGGFDNWQPDLFGGAGKERGEGRTKAEQLDFARREMRDTGSRSLFDFLSDDDDKRKKNPRRLPMHHRRNPSFDIPVPDWFPVGHIELQHKHLLLGAGVVAAAYIAFTRGGGASGTDTSTDTGSSGGSGIAAGFRSMFGARTHSSAWVNPSTGMVYQHSRPNTPPVGVQGTGEWVVVNCPDHSPGVCWQWEPLSTLTLPGVPMGAGV